MEVLITGGAGFIGQLLSRQLANSHEVTVLDNFLYGNKTALPEEVKIVEGDVRDLKLLLNEIKNTDVVIHLASIVGDEVSDLNQDATIGINFLSTNSIAHLCNIYGKKMIFASTTSVYGNNPGKDMKEDDVITQNTPLSLYAKTKLMSESAITNNLKNFAILRLGTAFGVSPRMRFDLAVNLFMAKAFHKEKITLYGSEQCRPWINVEDAAAAFAFVLDNNLNGVYNISWRNMRIKDLVEEIKRHAPDLEYEVSDKVVDERNYTASTEKMNSIGFATKKELKETWDEMTHLFKSGAIRNWKSSKYSNYKYLFKKKEMQEALYTKGPIGEKENV